ncbi:DUF7109 family protein [Natronomonas sp.]|uniref:DUF7109 family protein n=1 Tax=Natronomonas sp. TaxID=2184060 RepID=UPI00261961BB|nr:hypothetical protein [Natronomonas sp.]
MFTPDETAGIVDLFGALSRANAERALSELAYRRGEEPPEAAIDDAVEAFALVELETDGETVLAPGPAAFPELPAGSEDLPHILDTEGRSVDREAVARAAAERLRAAADRAVAAGDADRAAELLEVSYDVEAWGAPALPTVRDRLEGVADNTN